MEIFVQHQRRDVHAAGGGTGADHEPQSESDHDPSKDGTEHGIRCEYEVSRQGGQAVKDERVIKCRKQGRRRKFFPQLQPAETEHGDIEDRHEAGKRDPEEMLCHKTKSCGSRGDHVQRQNEEDDSRSVDRETEQDNRSLDNDRCRLVLFCF